MAVAIYALCAATSLLCALLLMRGYRTSGARLLLWSALCFAGLFLNNVLLLVDMRVVADMSSWRALPSLIGASVLVFGLVWETRA